MKASNPNLKTIWIEAGYHAFAKNGKAGLKVLTLAKTIGKSKSSFYHFFADLEVFTDELLNHHISRARVIAEQEAQCKNINPELIDILVASKTDLLFNRQLRVYREDKRFAKCFEKTNEMVAASFLNVWSRDIGLQHKPKVAEALFKLVIENFYLQLTEETLTKSWLADYFAQVKNVAVTITSSNP